MRQAAINDSWRRVYQRNYIIDFSELDLNGIGGLEKLKFNKGIFAICGLNGAGKSTILSVLKDILGMQLNKQDEFKVNGKLALVQANKNGQNVTYKNISGERLNESLEERLSLTYFDYKMANDILEFFLGQQNLEEYLQQFDDYSLNSNELDELNFIVGKTYEECRITEIEDGDIIIPHFRIKSFNVTYDSLTMGMGEHNVFYMFWLLRKIEHSGILLIEEPETFLSISSQKNIMDYIAEKTSKYGITTIITTHSPYIINKIPLENICVVCRHSGGVNIYSPAVDIDVLGFLGIEKRKRGIIYVEDQVAECFLKTLISRHCDFLIHQYNIENVSGESHITERLKFPCSSKFEYNIIGVYDGDMRDAIRRIDGQLKCKYGFLPGTLAIENSFKTFITADIPQFIKIINGKEEAIMSILSAIEGQDHHDWFKNLCDHLGFEINVMIDKIYDKWYCENRSEVEAFIDELKTII